jgi:hypothetical protein
VATSYVIGMSALAVGRNCPGGKSQCDVDRTRLKKVSLGEP